MLTFDFQLLINTRSGSFAKDLQATIDDDNGASYALVVADVDGDGDLDVIGSPRRLPNRGPRGAWWAAVPSRC